MTSLHLRRALAVATAAMLGLMLLAPTATLAAQPGWEYLNPQKLPDAVNPGALAGYGFRINNHGPSNISQLFLTSTISTPAAFVSTSRDTQTSSPCVLTPRLKCTFGALNNNEFIDVIVAYSTAGATGTTFDVAFQLNSTGDTPSDGTKGTSHGDTKTQAFSTQFRSDKNFAGGFSTTGVSFGNSTDLGPKNIQAANVTTPSLVVGASIEDGLADNAYSCTGQTECAHRFGEWVRLDVNKGATITGGIKVEILILGNKVPNGATLANIDVIHVRDDGTTYTIETRCDGVTTLDSGSGAECVSAVNVGNNVKVTVWLANNGGNRLSY